MHTEWVQTDRKNIKAKCRKRMFMNTLTAIICLTVVHLRGSLLSIQKFLPSKFVNIKANTMLKILFARICNFWNFSIRNWKHDYLYDWDLIVTSGRKFINEHESWLVLRLVASPISPPSCPCHKHRCLGRNKLVGETSAGTIQRLPHHPYTNFFRGR